MDCELQKQTKYFSFVLYHALRQSYQTYASPFQFPTSDMDLGTLNSFLLKQYSSQANFTFFILRLNIAAISNDGLEVIQEFSICNLVNDSKFFHSQNH